MTRTSKDQQAAPGPIETSIRHSVEETERQIGMAESYLQILRRQRQDLIRLQQGQGMLPSFSPKAKSIDAIEVYLKQQGRPKTADEIIAAMVEWGINAGMKDQQQQIMKSIQYALYTVAEKKKRWPKRTAPPPRLKMFAGRIGLPEWKEGHFPADEKPLPTSGEKK
ncbi:MAG TPA: hypothetical protein VKY85_07540 [Candidatus Angelobacter sp.]|nr:hypothetical protein [Candidatus Angelobacter sp.]